MRISLRRGVGVGIAAVLLFPVILIFVDSMYWALTATTGESRDWSRAMIESRDPERGYPDPAAWMTIQSIHAESESVFQGHHTLISPDRVVVDVDYEADASRFEISNLLYFNWPQALLDPEASAARALRDRGILDRIIELPRRQESSKALLDAIDADKSMRAFNFGSAYRSLGYPLCHLIRESVIARDWDEAARLLSLLDGLSEQHDLELSSLSWMLPYSIRETLWSRTLLPVVLDGEVPAPVCQQLLLQSTREAEKLRRDDWIASLEIEILQSVDRWYEAKPDLSGRWVPSAGSAMEKIGNIEALWHPRMTSFANELARFARELRSAAQDSWEQRAVARRWSRPHDYPVEIPFGVDDLGLLFASALYLRHEATMHVESRRLILALELWRQEHGSYPGSLTRLAPSILNSIPDDPVAGAKFGYEMLQDGRSYVLYSFGKDGVDDGGKFAQESELRSLRNSPSGFDAILSEPPAPFTARLVDRSEMNDPDSDASRR